MARSKLLQTDDLGMHPSFKTALANTGNINNVGMIFRTYPFMVSLVFSGFVQPQLVIDKILFIRLYATSNSMPRDEGGHTEAKGSSRSTRQRLGKVWGLK